jgi:hypothetical protein
VFADDCHAESPVAALGHKKPDQGPVFPRRPLPVRHLEAALCGQSRLDREAGLQFNCIPFVCCLLGFGFVEQEWEEEPVTLQRVWRYPDRVTQQLWIPGWPSIYGWFVNWGV